jgi:uncharacterized membrane protein
MPARLLDRLKRFERLEAAGVAMVMVGAAAITSRALDAKSLWIDEAISVYVANLGFADVWRFVSQEEMNMAVYHLVLHEWMRIGTSENAVRALSVVFAVLTLPVLYSLGSRLFSRRVGLTAAVLLALNPMFFSYAREARSYALTLLLVTVSMLLLVHALQEPGRLVWVAYVVVSVLAVYSHLFAAFVLIAQAASLALPPHERVSWRLIWPAAAIGLLLLPAALFIATADQGKTTDQGTSLGDVTGFFSWLAGGNRPLLALYGIAALGAVLAEARASPGLSAPRRWPIRLVLSWLLVPLALALLVAVTIDPVFVFRYLLVVLPALLLLVARGINFAGRPAVAVAVLIIVSAVSSRAVLACHPGCTPTQDFRTATATILVNATPPDAFVFDPRYLKIAFVYYADGHEDAHRCRTPFCSGDADHPQIVSADRRVWLLIDDGDPNTDQHRDDLLDQRFRPARSTMLPSRLRVVLYVRRP